MATPPDPLVALVAFLTADADVASLASGRVYGAELPGELSGPTIPSSVVVQDAGGFGRRGKSPEYHQRIDVMAYAPTPFEAKQLQLACTNALRQMGRVVINGTILYSAVQESGPNPGRSPESFWSFSWSVWSVETNYQLLS